MKLDYQYFSLSQSGPAWEAVQRARNFAVYVPAEITDPETDKPLVKAGKKMTRRALKRLAELGVETMQVIVQEHPQSPMAEKARETLNVLQPK